jgi:alcohol dehydrogenase
MNSAEVAELQVPYYIETMSSVNQPNMYAWRLSHPGGPFTYQEVPRPAVRNGSVLVRMQATPILSYLKAYVAGLPHYAYPKVPFTPGTNGAGRIEAVGGDVWHLQPGQRVVVSPHLVASENVEEPAQVLAGLTAISPDSEAFFTTWRDGTLAEYLLAPANAVTPVQDDSLSADQLALLGRLAVPFGGLLRGRLSPGETVVIVGATGNFGSAAVLLACALGAERVVAAGRNVQALDEVAKAAGARVHPVKLTGDSEADAAALRQAAGGGAHLTFDMVGQAQNAEATLAGLRSLRRWGRLVLMGSMAVPLPLTYAEVMLNNLEIIGNFMYPANVFLKLLALIRAGLLDLRAIEMQKFSLADLPAAMDAAEKAGGLSCTVANASGEADPD